MDTTELGSTPAASHALAVASASFALASAAEGFSVRITSARILCLGAAEGMTRHSHTENTIPREMVAAVSQRGTPTLAWRQATQSDHFKWSLLQVVSSLYSLSARLRYRLRSCWLILSCSSTVFLSTSRNGYSFMENSDTFTWGRAEGISGSFSSFSIKFSFWLILD